MSNWIEFLAALTFFLLSHMIPVHPPVRSWLISKLSQRGYFISYSVLSAALLIWLIGSAARAPYVEIIPPSAVFRWVPILVMPVACYVAVAGLIISNPFSFGGFGRTGFLPDNPGILAVSRHPLLLALILWSLAHVFANGDLAHVVLFGLFAGFAGIGMVLIDRRTRRHMGANWQIKARNTARLSPLHLGAGWSMTVFLLSAVLFAALLAVHTTIIGVSPLP